MIAMTGLSHYQIQQKYKLSVEMYLALCYIAQDHRFRSITHGRTLKALRKRRLVDRENELTNAGWECYIELTNAGPCGTSGDNGRVPKDPRFLYEAAKPRLDAIDSQKEAKREKAHRKPGSSNQRGTAPQKSRTGILKVKEVKYGGRLIVLDDGSRWEIDETDSSVSKSWSRIDYVVIIDDEMYRLDDTDKVSVELEN